MKRLFIDMDGTIAQYPRVEAIEEYFETGHYINLLPINSVLNGVKDFIYQNPDVEVFILSAVHPNTTAIQEKNDWLDYYLPEVNSQHRIFTECGKDKSSYIKNGISSQDYLLDDYTKNLISWKQSGGEGIKLLNGINHSSHSWLTNSLTYKRDTLSFSDALKKIILENQLICDKKPDIQLRIENDENIYVPEDLLKNIISDYYKDFSLKAFLNNYRPDDVRFIKGLIPDEIKIERVKNLSYMINQAKSQFVGRYVPTNQNKNKDER